MSVRNKGIITTFRTFRNSIFCNLYAKLFNNIIEINPTYKTILKEKTELYFENINAIKIVTPNEDYDGFCDYNTINEIRKANSMFIVNLMKRDMISRQEFIDLLLYMQNTSLKYISMENKVHEVEEITENIFILCNRIN